MHNSYKKDWQEEFDKRALHSDKEHELIGVRESSLLESKRIFLGALKGLPQEFRLSNVLDAGCGPGIFTNILHGLGYKNIYGVDFSTEIIKKAVRNSPPEINYLVGDIKNLPFPDGFFDLVVCFGVFQCLNKEKEQIPALEEIARVLNKNGILLLYTLNKFSLKNLLPERYSEGETKPTRYSPFQFCKYLEEKNLKIIKLKGIYIFPLSQNFLAFIHKYKIYDFLDRFFRITNLLSHYFYIRAKKIC